MTERRDHDEHPELLLVGADRPRPLPPGLRARLEGALKDVGAPEGDGAKPLSAGTRHRLESSLRPARPGKWRALMGAAGAAAAIALLAAVLVPGLVHAPHARSVSAGKPAASRPNAFSVAGHAPSPPLEPANGPATPVVRRAVPANLGPRPPAERTPHAAKATSGGTTVFSGLAPAPSAVYATVRNGEVVGAAQLAPSHGPAKGGNWVVVETAAAARARLVYFGGVPAVRVVPVSPTDLKVLVPAHAAGAVAVTVSLRVGKRAELAATGFYTFVGSR